MPTYTLPRLPSSSYPLVLSEKRWLRYVTFFYLYVMQGIPAGFALYALANYLTAHGLSPAVVGSFAAIVGLPWSFQFIWGPLIDKYQNSAMGRRKPWVLFSQLLAFLASLGLLSVENPVRQLPLLQLTFFIHSIFASVQDASVDALAISVIPEHERGRITAVMRGGFLGGIALGSALLSLTLHTYGFLTAVSLQSLLLLSLTIVTFFIKEEPIHQLVSFQTLQADADLATQPSFRWLFRELWAGIFARKSLLLFIPILLYYSCQSIFTRAYSVHLIQVLHWPDTDVTVLQGTVGTLVVILIVLIGGIIADRVGPPKLMLLVMIFSALSFLIFNALHTYWQTPGVARSGLILWSVMDPAFSVASMPVLMTLCRTHVEGSQFTAYMALVNLSDIAGAYLSGQAQTYTSAPVIGLSCGFVLLLSIAIIAYGQYKTRMSIEIRPS